MSPCQISSILTTVTLAGGLGMLVLGAIMLVRIKFAALGGGLKSGMIG